MIRTEGLNMLSTEFYRSIAESFFQNPIWKAVIAAFFSLFTVPMEFVLAIPVFWVIDFGAGIYASRRDGKPWDWDKLNAQFVKISIHITFLIGCTVLANLYNIDKLIYFGFGYIIVNEFLFSTVPHLFGDKKAAKIVKHIKGILFRSIGIKFEDPEKGVDNENHA